MGCENGGRKASEREETKSKKESKVRAPVVTRLDAVQVPGSARVVLVVPSARLENGRRGG